MRECRDADRASLPFYQEAMMAPDQTGFGDVVFDFVPVHDHALRAWHDYRQHVRDVRTGGYGRDRLVLRRGYENSGRAGEVTL